MPPTLIHHPVVKRENGAMGIHSSFGEIVGAIFIDFPNHMIG
jgi:hypothetical protein